MACSGQGAKNGACCQKPTQPLSDFDTDDIWGSDEESISVHADLKRAHHNQGYVDGITRQQEQSLQNGFDEGFPQGAQLGREVGKILAKLHGTSQFPLAKTDLNVTKILDKKYFDEQLDLRTKTHPEIKRYEREIGN